RLERLADVGAFGLKQRRLSRDLNGLVDITDGQFGVDAHALPSGESYAVAGIFLKALPFDLDLESAGGQVGHYVDAVFVGRRGVRDARAGFGDRDFGPGDRRAAGVGDVADD